ncbi:hypothetical protein RMATCC62417_01093 [Rhizopus microsporus]|nr:hypothetical protein RMATCC62417_01093 [Rhizopus microsporus]
MTSLKSSSSSSSHSSNSRSPSLNTTSTTNTFLSNSPLPALSITNKPSNGTSLYHTCRSVLEKLSLVPNMEYYIDYTTDDDTTPLNKLWAICRRGFPLAALFNALDPQEPLSVDPSCTQVNECKKSIYHFIVACRNQLGIHEDDLFTLSDLYKDNTNGFVKVVNTIDIILQMLEERGVITSINHNRNSFNEPKDARDKVVLELLETERKYVQDLEILQNYKRELQLQEILNPDTVHYLFGNLNTLVDFQRRFLIQLEEMAEKSPEDQDFGSLFIQNEDSFTVYEPYCSNFFSAQDLVVQEAPKLQKLADILNPIYELPSMLIKPVQRICKYPLLMHQLIKATNPSWPHVLRMEQGLISIKRVTEKVNETQRKLENIQIVDEIKNRVDELRRGEIGTYGALLLHDKLFMSQSDAPEKELLVYFFEKTILICKESKDSTKNKPVKSNTISIKKKRRGSLQLKGMIMTSRIVKVRNHSSSGSWCLTIDFKDREVDHVLFRFRNEEQMKLWESSLQRHIRPMKSNVSNTQLMSMKGTNLTEVPPFLRTDDDSSTDYSDQECDSPTMHRSQKKYSISRHITDQPPRTSSHHHMQHLHDYPASPPPSHPSSPRAMDEYPPYLMNRSQSQSVVPGQPLLYTSRVRSQSSPNIKQRQQQQQQQHWDEPTPPTPQFINSKTLYNMAPPSPLDQPLKLKLNFNDGIYVIMTGLDISYSELVDKVDRKIRLIANLQPADVLRLKYQDEDGDFITINSDEDVQMAFENRGATNTINLFLSI